jgi:hypothetical protein
VRLFHFGKDARYFRVLIEGKNVLLKDVDTSVVERLGFYTTRFVKAANPTMAAAEAIALTRKELEGTGTLNEPSNAPMMEAIEVEEVARGRAKQVKGFTFFPDGTN